MNSFLTLNQLIHSSFQIYILSLRANFLFFRANKNNILRTNKKRKELKKETSFYSCHENSVGEVSKLKAIFDEQKNTEQARQTDNFYPLNINWRQKCLGLLQNMLLVLLISFSFVCLWISRSKLHILRGRLVWRRRQRFLTKSETLKKYRKILLRTSHRRRPWWKWKVAISSKKKINLAFEQEYSILK